MSRTLKPWLDDGDVRLYHGDAAEVLRALPAESVQTCVTSPPYWGLRDYGSPDQLGLEATPQEYVAKLVDVFRAVRRALRPDGTVWLNLGDSYASNPAKGGSGPGAKQGAHVNYGRAMRPGAGRADGVVDARAQRNRDGVPRTHGLKEKDLVGVPWRVAFALQDDGWYLRSDIIWAKPNPMPESVTDRPTKAHEYVFLLSKGPRYYYDANAIREDAKDWSVGGPGTGIENTAERYGAGNGGNAGLGALADRYKRSRAESEYMAPTGKRHTAVANGGRNRRSVWTVTTQPYPGAHFATFPPKLIEPCVLAGCPEGGTVLDPFSGSGTTALVARNHQRRAIGIDLSEDYLRLAADRLSQLSLFGGAVE